MSQYQWVKQDTTAHSWAVLASSSDGKNLCASGSNKVYTSSDYGVTWTDQTSMALNSVASSSDGSKLVGTVLRKIFTSTNAGVTWTDRTTCPDGTKFKNAVSSADGVNLLVGTSSFTQAGPAVYSSSSSGATWGPSTFTAYGRFSGPFACSSDGKKLVAIRTYGSTDSLYTSTYYGMDWTAQPDGIGLHEFSSVTSSSDGSILYAGTGDYIYKSTNSGVDWTRTGAPFGIWAHISCSGDGSKIIAANNATPTPVIVGDARLYISNDSGATWTAQIGSGQHSWGAVTISSDGSRFAAAAVGSWSDGTSGSFIYDGPIYTAQFEKQSGSWGPFLKAKISA